MRGRDRLLLLGSAIVAVLVASAALRGATARGTRAPDVVRLALPTDRLERGPAFEPSLRLRPRTTDVARVAIDPAHPRVVIARDLGARIRALVAVDGPGLIAVTTEPDVVELDGAGTPIARTRLPAASVTTPVVVGDARIVGTDGGELIRIARGGGVAARIAIPDGGPIDSIVRDRDSLLVVAGHRLVRLDLPLPTTIERRSRDRAGEPETLAILASFDLGARAIGAPVIADDGSVVLGTQSERVVLLAPTLVPRWTYRGFADVDASPAITDDGLVVAGSRDHRVVAIEGSGVFRYAIDVGGAVRAPIAARGATAFVATLGPRPRLLGLDRAGALAFRFSARFTDDEDEGFRSAIVFLDGSLSPAIALGGVDDVLHVVGSNGRELARIPARGDVDVGPIVLSDGSLAFGGEDGIVRIIR